MLLYLFLETTCCPIKDKRELLIGADKVMMLEVFKEEPLSGHQSYADLVQLVQMFYLRVHSESLWNVKSLQPVSVVITRCHHTPTLSPQMSSVAKLQP